MANEQTVVETTTKETPKKVEKKALVNVYQKLITARKVFLDAGVKKSGINRHLEYQYFELVDIVPNATTIFEKLGLIAITSFTKDYATLTIVNCDNPEERIEFTSPMVELAAIVSSTGKVVANEIQTMGSLQTYQRRYLYMMALDIVESDSIDANAGNVPVKEEAEKVKKDKEPKPTTKKPATNTERKEIKEELTATTANADELQIKGLKAALKDLVELDETKKEFASQIAFKTNNFTTISKENCDTIIKKVRFIIDELKKGQE